MLFVAIAKTSAAYQGNSAVQARDEDIHSEMEQSREALRLSSTVLLILVSI